MSHIPISEEFEKCNQTTIMTVNMEIKEEPKTKLPSTQPSRGELANSDAEVQPADNDPTKPCKKPKGLF